MPLKKSTRSKTTATKKSSGSGTRSKKTSKTPTWSVGAGTMLLAAMCVTGAVIVIAARELTPAPRAASADLASDSVVATESPKAPSSTSASVAPESVMANAPESDALETKGTVGRTAPVTIFGCLQQSDSAFRLTDTDGVDAPKSRSWKTAFLKKGATSIAVTDPGNRNRLASHVGQRLSVTGTLVDRQMQVRSIRRISPSCD